MELIGIKGYKLKVTGSVETIIDVFGQECDG